ncbi:MAG: biotin--[acetyl-CoA-carboxylase] ligase [Rikenellaceae bacterium]
MNLYIYEETTSTNNLGRESIFHHSDVIWAYSQSAGRGQRGNKWIGGEGENITFSIVLEPTFLDPSEQFRISQITALALCDAMRFYGIESRIKWTNDIYVGDKKMAGILIENSINAESVTRSVVGIGLNINQLEFDLSLPNPTSMRRVTSRRFSREEVLQSVHDSLMLWCERLKNGEVELINSRYHELLYRLNERYMYRLASGEVIGARIEGVDKHGELMLRMDDGALQGYLFREVEFIIDGRDRIK